MEDINKKRERQRRFEQTPKRKKYKREYMRKYMREYKKIMRKRYPERFKVWDDNKRRKMKKRLLELKMKFGGKCEKCGYNKCIQSLEFAHKNTEEKEFALSVGYSKNYTMEKMEIEAAKCRLLCANCHREETYAERV